MVGCLAVGSLLIQGALPVTTGSAMPASQPPSSAIAAMPSPTDSPADTTRPTASPTPSPTASPTAPPSPSPTPVPVTTGTPAADGTPGPGGGPCALRKTPREGSLLGRADYLAAGATPATPVAAAPIPSIAPGHFARAAALPAGGGYDTATLLPNGKVLFLGAGKPELYDPAANRFSSAGPMVQERAGPLVTLLPDGKVLVYGGTGFGGCSVGPIDSAELYDPTTDRFTGLDVPPTDTFQAATPLADGTVLLTGGLPADCCDPGTWGWDPYTYTASAIFDPKTSMFTKVESDIQPPNGAAIAVLPDHTVLFAGGLVRQIELWLPISKAVLYDPEARKFVPISASTTVPRGNSSATVLPDGKVLIAGNVEDDPACPVACLQSAEIFDPATARFTPAGAMGVARHRPTATELSNGDVLVTGGSAHPANGAEVWSAGVFHPTAGTMTQERFETVAVGLPDGRVLVVGGGSADLYQP
jgi:hypothetical protein